MHLKPKHQHALSRAGNAPNRNGDGTLEPLCSAILTSRGFLFIQAQYASNLSNLSTSIYYVMMVGNAIKPILPLQSFPSLCLAFYHSTGDGIGDEDVQLLLPALSHRHLSPMPRELGFRRCCEGEGRWGWGENGYTFFIIILILSRIYFIFASSTYTLSALSEFLWCQVKREEKADRLIRQCRRVVLRENCSRLDILKVSESWRNCFWREWEGTDLKMWRERDV